MNTIRVLLVGAGLLWHWAAAAAETSANGVSPPAAQRIELAPKDADNRSVENYLGAAVFDPGGNKIAEVREFLADERTSQLAYAVIAGWGVFGLGETSRLVPISELKRTNDGFRVDPSKALPPNTPAFSKRLTRISELEGKDIAAGETDVGEIEDVIVDLNRNTVRALLDPDRDFAGRGDKVLVPLGKFVFTEESDEVVGTILTREDFNQLYPSWDQTTGPREPADVARRHREEIEKSLTPAGRPQ